MLMKSILKHTIFDGLALYLTSIFLGGVVITGNILTYLIAGFILAGLFKVFKPILSVFSLPLNVITLGLFSFFINTILLYILTILLQSVTVVPFTFNGFNFAGFIIPVMHFGSFTAFIIAAIVLSVIINLFEWLTD